MNGDFTGEEATYVVLRVTKNGSRNGGKSRGASARGARCITQCLVKAAVGYIGTKQTRDCCRGSSPAWPRTAIPLEARSAPIVNQACAGALIQRCARRGKMFR
jgi:hypothetical protein